MSKLEACWIPILCLAWLLPKTVHADWINLTGAEIAPNIAEIHVHDDHIRVKLEVFIGHIAMFEELLPDEWLTDLDAERPSLQQRQQQFANRGLKITTGDGKVLPARFELVEPRTRVDRRSPYAGKINPYNMKQLPDEPDDKRVLYAEILYPFDVKPERLVITPPLNDKGDIRVTIGFITYHGKVQVTDFRFLGRAEALDLDWIDPWYSRFENKNLSRHHRYPIMLFLYAEPRRIRMESIMRIDDLEEMLGFDAERTTDSALFRNLLKDRLRSYFGSENLLDIDGRGSAPDSVRIEYLTTGLSGISVVENSVDLRDPSLFIGVVLEYFIAGLPHKFEFEWRYFNRRFDRIPVTVNDPAGPLPGFIGQQDSVISWQNFLKKYREPESRTVLVETGWNLDLPYFGVIRILDQPPDAQQAQSIIKAVLANLQAVFIEVQPSRFIAELDKVATSDDLESLATELTRLFAPRVSGSINGEVHEFRELQISEIRELDNLQGFSAQVSGIADIRARHWGHLDQRQVRFQLLLDLVESDAQWQLAEITVIDLKQVQ